MKRNLIITLVCILVIGVLFVVSLACRPKPPSPTTQAIWKQSGVPVETATVSLGDMDEIMQVTGDLEALNSGVISPKGTGRLMSVTMREGDRVSRGQVVAVLDQSDTISALQTAQAGLQSALARLAQATTTADVTRIQTQTAIEQAQATLASSRAKFSVAQKPTRSQERMVAGHRVDATKASLDKAEADYKRSDRLLKRGAISESTFEVAEAQYAVAQADYKSAQEQLGMIDEGGRREDISSAQAQVDVAQGQVRDAHANAAQTRIKEKDVLAARAAVAQAQASVDTARRQLDDTYIKSPISGIISVRSADPGQIVSPGQVLARVVDLESVYLKGDIPEKYLAQVSKGQPVDVRIEAMPGRGLVGSVAEIYPAGSTANRNFSVRIAIQRAGATVRPGMSASGDILLGRRHGVLLVPKDAVDDQEGTQSVFIVQPKGTVKRQTVSVLKTDQRSAEIGLPATVHVGDTVVTQGRKNLQDGARVEIQAGRRLNHVAH